MFDQWPCFRIEAVIHRRSVVHSLESVDDRLKVQAALAADLGLQHAS